MTLTVTKNKTSNTVVFSLLDVYVFETGDSPANLYIDLACMAYGNYAVTVLMEEQI